MANTKLTRTSQTWALAYENYAANPMAPTTTELNANRFVHFVSCALTEDGTELVKGDSETDDTTTFCDVGQNTTLGSANITAQFTWLKDANTGGSGSTVDLTSLYNKVTTLISYPDVRFWIISRTGPQGAQDAPFAVGQVIKAALFSTDYRQLGLDQNAPIKGIQNFVFQGAYAWNVSLAS